MRIIQPLATLIAGLSFFGAATFASEPFAECPSKAFLFQGNNVQIYSVNLATGSFGLLENNVGMGGNINGVGFSFDDRYLYGFNTTTFDVVRLGQNFQAQPLEVTGLPTNTTFYVGDVSDSTYWVYRKSVGLYRINLDITQPNYLQAIKIDGADTSLTLTDFAFHPTTGELFAVDNKTGDLFRIDLTTGQSQSLGNTGITGTFGAGYFDVNGYYYISRNQDGQVFRIDISEPGNPLPTAEYFAQGPYSSQNDGARCAFAPIEVENTDFGDAPDSYLTTLNDNGPRHEISDHLTLGASVPDAENDGYAFPQSDDDLLYDDEDGVQFLTELSVGLDARLRITVTGTGYLNAWFDWNQNGMFDVDEQALTDFSVTTNTYELPIRVPDDALAGDTWARFRLTSSQGTRFYGGAADGEVEDHRIKLQPTTLSYRYYPSKQGWVTLAYEDNWPVTGDYDLNDVVVHYRVVEIYDQEQVHRIDIQGQVLALGADYQSGFAVHLQDVPANQVISSEMTALVNGHRRYRNSLRDQPDATVNISDDLHQTVQSDCAFYRTVSTCDSTRLIDFEVSLPFSAEVSIIQIPSVPFNPFIFGTTDAWRGSFLRDYQSNQVEVHLPNFSATSQLNSALFQQGDDDSQPALNRYFKTRQHLPWALLIPTQWRHPKEGIDILNAYPKLQDWAESNGLRETDWYLIDNANIDQIF